MHGRQVKLFQDKEKNNIRNVMNRNEIKGDEK